MVPFAPFEMWPALENEIAATEHGALVTAGTNARAFEKLPIEYPVLGSDGTW